MTTQIKDRQEKEKKVARWVKSMFGNKQNEPKKLIKKHQPTYFHQIVCLTCGKKIVTAGFNLNSENKTVRIDFDCAKCGETICGLTVPKEKLQFMIDSELQFEKIKDFV